MAVHPPLLSHPVLVARLLLYLAHGIQNIHPCALDVDALELVSPSLSMTAFFKAATRITKKDHLLNSLEGLECLILEGTFLINAGELRNARDTFRRAWHLARDMRLPCQGAEIVTLDSQSIASSSFMWYRIVHQDRYLAVMLDQKAYSENDNVLIDGRYNAADNLSDHLEQTHCRLMGRLASRLGTVDIQTNLEETMSIDRALKDMARQVPPKWWALPTVNRWDGGPDESLEDVLKLLIQITHYHLSIMLHLPHSLRESKSQDQYNYSRIACVSASRELVNRYVRFRSTTRVAFCCRAIDYAVFTACVALILAHLVTGTEAEGSFSSILAHQRLSDQAIVAEVVGLIAELDMLSNDRQLSELSSMLSFLASIDLMDNPKTSDEGRTDTFNTVSPFRALQLTLPCVGRVLISKEGVKMNESNECPSSHGQPVARGLLNCNMAQQEDGHVHFENRDQQNAFGGLSDVNWMNPEVSAEYPPWDDQAQPSPELAHFCDALDFSSYSLISQ
jgi:hypothetical protein